jgi:hypothetical protein
MADLSKGTALVHPTTGYSLPDYEMGKFRDLGGGTIAIRTYQEGGGATGYSEGTTIGTASGNVIIFRSTGGTTRAVGTQYPLPVQEQYAPAYEDNSGSVAAVAFQPTPSARYSPNGTLYAKGSAAVGTVLKNTPGQFMGANVTNESGSLVYFQVYNLTTRPATGSVPVLSYAIPAASGSQPAILRITKDDLGGAGFYLSTGVSFGISNAAGTYAEAGTANHVSNLLWI